MSGLGSRPKIASGSSTEPAALPSSETILSSMSGTFGLARLVRFSRRCFAGAAGALRQTELAGFGSVCRQSFLHRIAKRDPTALRARHRALDQDEAGLDVGNGEMAARGLCQALWLAGAGAELQRDIAVLIFRAVADNLAVGKA